jgi:hypothetical protein
MVVKFLTKFSLDALKKKSTLYEIFRFFRFLIKKLLLAKGRWFSPVSSLKLLDFNHKYPLISLKKLVEFYKTKIQTELKVAKDNNSDKLLVYSKISENFELKPRI